MKQVNLLVFASLCCLVSSTPQSYYITPTNDPQGSCHVNGTTLRPCYTLQQLNGVLSSSNGSVEVLFLPGKHLIPEKETVMINVSEVVIRPWNSELEMVIECISSTYYYEYPTFWFQNIIQLKILSLRFSSCKLQYGYEMNNKTERSVNITKSVFEKSAVDIRSSESNLNVTVSNCTFSLSSRGTLYMLPPGYDNARPQYYARRVTIGNLQITDTLFHDNTNVNAYLSIIFNVVYANLMISNCRFINNSISESPYYKIIIGEGVYVVSSFLILQNTTFLHSHDKSNTGSALHLRDSSGTIDACLFSNNSADNYGGALLIEDSIFSISNSIFEENSATALYINSCTFSVAVSFCTFRNNSGKEGGALHVEKSVHVDISNSNFSFNNAYDGGAIYCVDSAIRTIGAIYSFSNSAGTNGGHAYFSNCKVNTGNIDHYYGNNRASNGGAIFAERGTEVNTGNIDHYYGNNRASNGGAIFAERGTSIALYNAIVTNNIAYKNGGAFYLDKSDVFNFGSDVLLIFSNNVAKKKGGAIFVPDTNCESSCFIKNIFTSELTLKFTNSTAPQGPVLYGGLLDRCYDNLDDWRSYKLGIDVLKSISKYEHTPEAITSDPVRICFCTENHELDCTTRNFTVSDKSTGQIITLLGTVVDQDNNPKASYIRAGYNETTAELGKGEGRRKTGKNCSKLSYHIFSRNTSATLILRPEGICESSHFSSVTVHIKIKPCPRGFEQNDDQCECDKRLSNRFKGMVCDVNADTITTKESTTWLRYDENYLKVQANCPLDYCQTTDNISLENPDEQCANNRSGVICGSCQDNFSIGLGGSKCLQCTSNSPLIWLIPVFAVAGVALVALLLVCNMTLSHGTLNGLIFYANVVSITRLTSLQSCSIHPILSVFIAWVNLDFGVETCFYSGMDTYQKTWLQFAFPLYIWLLVGAIILVSHYSFTAVKVFGRNNIAILATLFLLSYTKILKNIITALNFTQVFQGSADDTSDQLVPYYAWIYDGNIEYLKGKHVALFAVALVFLVFLFLPYTLLLMFGQCIRSIPTQRRCVLRFLNSTAFVSIIDAYHAPYNNTHRYWTGLMLLSRCVLFLAFSFNYSDSGLLVNMYMTTLVLIGILTIKTCTTKVYKNSLVNLLENYFLLNLVVLSGTINYLGYSDNTCICTSASISVSMAISAGILAYHTSLQLNKMRCFNSIKNSFLAKWRNLYHTLPANREEDAADREEDAADREEDTPPVRPAQRAPTRMVVELREELLIDHY